MENNQDIEKTIGKFIAKTFLFDPEKKIDPAASLLGTGVIDSTGVLELISFLESTYQLRFADEDLIAENFDSIEKIKKFLESKLNHSH